MDNTEITATIKIEGKSPIVIDGGLYDKPQFFNKISRELYAHGQAGKGPGTVLYGCYLKAYRTGQSVYTFANGTTVEFSLKHIS